ncbi:MULTISPECIES: hypothetical protein [unclassified Sphingobium]|uniref:hypothetical protein n=1 Tax=unclassified Sphingobium TaxID=2611147 RepID=UPI00077012D9|nr:MULTISPECIES: hypothetical protein [unclassified Sphingobium]AMK21870.1 hypothetical protein K426_04565 [Sphingobium sp. TKS]
MSGASPSSNPPTPGSTRSIIIAGPSSGRTSATWAKKASSPPSSCDVDWQRHPYARLNDATGFHLAEGRWPAVRTGKVCLLLTQPSGKATRLVEFKLFPD